MTPSLELNDGVVIPQIGFGVFQVPPAETKAAVSAALEAGYRSIDTATIYGNEEAVGEAIAESGLRREDLFITTKLWNTDQGRDTARPAFERSLQLLGLDHLDLYLIHWPCPGRDLYCETWEVLADVREEGLVRSIGVSNFLPAHLDRLVAETQVVPSVNQIEVHPTLQQRAAQEANARHGVVTEAWSPLAKAQILDSPVLVSIADEVHRTPAQVVLRWHLQQGRIIIPKSVTPARMAENIDVTDFELSSEQLAAIDTLEQGLRTGPDPDAFE